MNDGTSVVELPGQEQKGSRFECFAGVEQMAIYFTVDLHSLRLLLLIPSSDALACARYHSLCLFSLSVSLWHT
jgi:hypothetical protein